MQHLTYQDMTQMFVIGDIKTVTRTHGREVKQNYAHHEYEYSSCFCFFIIRVYVIKFRANGNLLAMGISK